MCNLERLLDIMCEISKHEPTDDRTNERTKKYKIKVIDFAYYVHNTRVANRAQCVAFKFIITAQLRKAIVRFIWSVE